MNIRYIFGGYLLTGGTLDNGKPWQGINIMYGESKNGNPPMIGKIAKARREDSIVDTLQNLFTGDFIEILCSPDGKVIELHKCD